MVSPTTRSTVTGIRVSAVGRARRQSLLVRPRAPAVGGAGANRTRTACTLGNSDDGISQEDARPYPMTRQRWRSIALAFPGHYHLPIVCVPSGLQDIMQHR